MVFFCSTSGLPAGADLLLASLLRSSAAFLGGSARSPRVEYQPPARTCPSAFWRGPPLSSAAAVPTVWSAG
eukprot:46959-Alexandrium_andersonii.AAC.1